MKASRAIRNQTKRTIRLINHFSRQIDETDFYPRGHVYLDRVLLGLLSKGLLVSKAVCLLVEAGLAQEAFGLSRTLLEIALTCRYVINRPSTTRMEIRAKRYVHYYAKVYSEWLKRVKKHLPQRSYPRNVRHQEFLKLARKYRSPYHWTLPPRSKRLRKLLGTNVAMMAREFDEHERLEGLPVTWDFDYEMIYFWTSQYVHGTVWVLNAHGVEPKEPFRVHHNKAMDKNLPGLALFNAAVFLFKLIVTVYRGLGHDQPERVVTELGSILKRLVKIRDVDMKTYRAITER